MLTRRGQWSQVGCVSYSEPEHPTLLPACHNQEARHSEPEGSRAKFYFLSATALSAVLLANSLMRFPTNLPQFRVAPVSSVCAALQTGIMSTSVKLVGPAKSGIGYAEGSQFGLLLGNSALRSKRRKGFVVSFPSGEVAVAWLPCPVFHARCSTNACKW